jgi:methylphosphotriester-DNA--protein-cysteine methyltransferase
VPEGIEEASLEKMVDLILGCNGVDTHDSARIIQKSVEYEANHLIKNRASDIFIANRNSDVFHIPSCKWTRMIKEDNIIVFDNMLEAEKKMFKPCRSCMSNTNGKHTAAPRTASIRKIMSSR